MPQRYWLMKCEPQAYSIDDLAREKKAYWEGVRNYQARNFMRDDMQVGDLALYYHSNADPSGVAGLMRITQAGYPDFTAWDRKSKYFDPKSSPDKPRWFMVDIEHIETFPHFVSLKEIKEQPALTGIMVAQRGSRLSIQPLSKKHFEWICKLGRRKS